LWYPETKTLEESQINKMDLVGRKLKLQPGMKVLDIGSGFGGAAKYMATKFGVSVTAYNISAEQVRYARENCKGLDVTIIEQDYRKATGQFDAVYSIGIFEHVGSKNYRDYFEVVNRCLKPDGLTLLHTITTADRQTRTDRWVNKYIFPGGELPYVNDLVQAPSGIFVVEDLQSFGKSYAKTLNCWRMNFYKNWENIEKKYKGQMNGKFFRMFEFYLAFCEGFFMDRTAQLHQVVYSKYPRDAEYYSVRDKRE
jgi:cyclopropane-fatty-acyl-phospholipid synthase